MTSLKQAVKFVEKITLDMIELSCTPLDLRRLLLIRRLLNVFARFAWIKWLAKRSTFVEKDETRQMNNLLTKRLMPQHISMSVCA